METATHLASWMTLSSMTQPLAQFGPMSPGWSAVGGAHGVAAWHSSKPADGDVVDVVLGGVEHGPPDVDLDETLVGVGVLEVRPDRRRVWADLRVPDVCRLVGVVDRHRARRPVVEHLVAAGGVVHLVGAADLVEAAAVEVDVAEVLALAFVDGPHDPVTDDFLGEGVEGAEELVGHVRPSRRSGALRLPVRHPLGALDDDVLACGGLVGDAAGGAEPAARGRDPLAVLTLVDDHAVAGLGLLRRAADRAEGRGLGPVRLVGAGGGDVQHGGHDGVSSRSGVGRCAPSGRGWPRVRGVRLTTLRRLRRGMTDCAGPGGKPLRGAPAAENGRRRSLGLGRP